MLIKEADADEKACPLSLASGHTDVWPCRGSACMAWRPVQTQHGEFGYCGMAGYPAKVAAPLLGQTLELALAGRGDAEDRGRVLVPNG